jgi:hypothetical protein
MQRFVYALAKDHHQEDPDDTNPTGMKQGHQATQGF